MEEDLRQSEEQFRTLANAIPQLCGMANPDGRFFWSNQRFYDYTALTPEQAEGWGWISALDTEASVAALESWRQSIVSGDAFESVFALRGADGVARPFLARAMPVRDRDGEVSRWFGTMTDISEQRRNEEALRKAHAEQLARATELQTFMDAVPVAEEDAAKAFPRGAVAGFLEKPYTLSSLTEKVDQALHSGGGPLVTAPAAA